MRGRRLSLSSTKLIRSFNAISVLQALYREGSATRTRLTEVTHMSPATITRIIAELAEQHVIIEERMGESNGGRKPVIFRLNYDQLFAVGIQILRDRVALGLYDIKGRPAAHKVFQQYSLEPEALLAELAREFETLLSASRIDREHVLGVGLAISGIVDSQEGRLVKSVNLGWRDVGVASMLEKLLGLQVIVENDANAAALAEMWFGGADDTRNLLYIKTDTGVGAGIVADGELLTGRRGMAGEIGHVPLFADGRPCRCGQKGCLETYLYLPDVLRRYAQETGRTVQSVGDLFASARAGDGAARTIVDEASKALAKTICFSEMLLDVETVVIGGAWGALGDDFCEAISNRLAEAVERAGLSKTASIRGSELGENSDLLGAVGLVINEWFTPPI